MLATVLISCALVGLWLTGSANSSLVNVRCADVGDFVRAEAKVSIKGILANIGADGSKVQGAPAGVVVASPSRSDPDYWYTWTRDAALTLKVLVERFIVHGDKSLQPKIEQYLAAQAQLQGVSNPSGGPDSGGLGEPKFHVNLTAFTGAWGRPQRDGPPLRATALTLYANWLLDHGSTVDKVWPVVSKDLAYAVQYWNRTGFDLWEEVNGSSFFTLAATHRALVEGAALARRLDKACPSCESSAEQVLCFLQSFWSNGYVDSNINVDDGRTGKDANSIISSIHTFDPRSSCTDSTFQPCSARALANHKAVVDSFRSIYQVNKGKTAGQAAAVGRYKEDVYYKGNPWYLCTLAAAEQLYDAVIQWQTLGSIVVTSVSLPFFKDLLPTIATGTYARGSDRFTSIITAVRAYADDFISVVQHYTPPDGSLAEQYDRNTGTPLSAVHLTWSYAAFISATDRRAGILPPSWGETRFNKPPSACRPAPRCDAAMTFSVRVTTVPGENIFLTGALAELKNWSPTDAIPLSASQYTADNPVWTVTVQVPAATHFEYKYILKKSDGSLVWMSDPNNSGVSSSTCGSRGSFDDYWR